MSDAERLYYNELAKAMRTDAVDMEGPKPQSSTLKPKNPKEKIVRPLVHWLNTRPNGMSVKDRHAAWRIMTADAKTQFSLDAAPKRRELA